MNGLPAILLILAFNSFDSQSQDYILAIFLLDHFLEIDSYTVNKLSDETGISPLKITKFIKKLGFHSFKEMKIYAVQGFNVKKSQIIERNANYSTDRSFNALEVLSGKTIDREKTLHQIDMLIEAIHSADTIYILGALYPSALTLDFCDEMVLYKKKVRFVWINSYEYDKNITLHDKELLLIVSYTGRVFMMKSSILSSVTNSEGKTAIISSNKSFNNFANYFLEIPSRTGDDDEYQNASVTELFGMIKSLYFDKYASTDLK